MKIKRSCNLRTFYFRAFETSLIRFAIWQAKQTAE